MSESTLRIIEEIRAKIGRLSRRLTMADLAYGALVTIGLIAGVLLATTLTEAIFWMPESVRWVLAILILLVVLAALARFVLRPILVLAGVTPGLNESEIARRVGRFYPNIKDRLTNFLDLVSGARSRSHPSLVEGAIAQLGMQVREPDYEKIERFDRARGVSKVAALPVVGLAAFLLINPTAFTGAASRLMHPGVRFERPAPFQFVVEPGDARIIRGDSLDFVIQVRGASPSAPVHLEIKRTDETRTRSVALTPSPAGGYIHTERNIRDPFVYRVVSEPVESQEYSVDVAARPFVRSFQVSLEPPRYTGLAAQRLAPNVGDFSAYPGTTVAVDVVGSGELGSAMIDFADADPVDLEIASSGASGSFEVVHDDTYRILLSDPTGLANDEPISYRIQRLVDAYPSITILRPSPLSELTEDLEVEIDARISDDFGFSSLSLFYRLSESPFGEPSTDFTEVKLEAPKPRLLDQDVSHAWELDRLPGIDLVPGDVIEFYLEVRDNDAIAGRKRTATPIHTLRFPSLTEQFDQLDETQNSVEGDLQSLMEESQQVKESFEQLRDELRREQNGGWDEERQLERLREEQKKLEERARDLSDKVDNMVEDMQMQDLVTPKTLEQFKELQRVFEEINSPELSEALERLRQAMEDLDLGEMQKSLGDFDFNEDQFQERIERALELFKRLRTEQKLEEAARRAEDLAQRQEQMQEKAKDSENAKNDDQEGKDQNERDGQRKDEKGEKAEQREQGDMERKDDAKKPDSDQPDQPQDQSEKQDARKPQSDESSRREDLAKEQERSAEDMKALEELMKRIEEMMKDLKSAPTEQMDQVMDQMEQQNLPSQMQQNAQQMRQGQMGKAQQGQQQMQMNLQQMAQDLQQMQMQMSGQQLQANLAALRRALDDVLTLSLEEESLRDQVREVASRDAGLRRFTQQQAELHEGLDTVGDSLVAMARNIPQMSREIQEHAGRASLDMSNAVDEMTERRGGQALGYQKSAMTNLNDLALLLSDLMSSMQNMQGGMGGMSMQQMMQQLQDMAGDQSKLNDQIQKMLNDMQGTRLSQDMGKRLQQLAGQQEALRKQLEQMQNDGPAAAEKLLGDLEQIAKEMQESINEMQSRNIDQKTIERQQEILTRLLTAQRSMRERGKENRREGKTADEIFKASPNELTPDQKAEQLRKELLDALESGYSPDYQELIRRYFEMLQQMKEPVP